MTTREAATRYGVTPGTVARWARLGLIAAEKVGRRWAIRAANAVIKTAARVVQVVAEVIQPEPPRKSLWAYRRELHGF